jgi:S-DNA-T family DNA segregation ATPase FtsK/SpoIIIE
MAKRKSRKTKDGIKLPIEITGIIFIIIGIIGFLGYKANIVGTIIKGFSMFLMGTFYFVLLAIFIIYGCYIIVKRDKPRGLSLKIIGLCLIILSVLALAHKEYLVDGGGLGKTMSDTIKLTVDNFTDVINKKETFPGGGIIGAFFISLLYSLLGELGSMITIGVLLLVGVILLFNVSISDFSLLFSSDNFCISKNPA